MIGFKDYKAKDIPIILPTPAKKPDNSHVPEELIQHIKSYNKNHDKRERKEWMQKAKDLLEQMS